MRMNFADFATFIAVARHRSFRAAGDELGLSSSAISHAIKQLEQRLKIRLFNRTTRSVSLTEAGSNLYERLRPAFDEINTMLDEVNCFRDTPMGTLKINAARQATRLFLMPLVTGFVRQYPDLKVEITTDDSLTNIVQQEFDAGVRLSAIVEKDMIAVPLGPPVKLSVVATPEYFAQYGKPAHPRELVNHQCVVFRFPSGRPYHWEFEGPEGRLEVATSGNIVLDDMDAGLDAVLMGAGVGFLFYDQVKSYLPSGQLVSVLEEWLPERPGFQLYYPNRQYMSCGLRAFLDYIKAPDNQINP
ncbi:LysR family transcriptional regulator [Budviciaceae bacterium CWB-B4]|uniref:LysR family transcriptional regulator n=1 Tax=Limnobaculum xujianqingii TaxID=2738837 RepID=A0A9D7AK51_9GAMM|nr:LysR family transcriptional regulator [Limnobaculum xujianqingii]MBK5074148.1 LysR family transcriptional regulator [Limnobaculum xujianqingii]MBK5177457.1 LysR family transcriptional regulator [Limnobaculum xujianqingii]